MQLVKAESRRRRVRTLATTHSPAILTALDAPDHAGVIVCDRDGRTGASRLRSLVDLPGYPPAMASGSLGEAVTRQRLEEEPQPEAALAALDGVLAGL